VNSTAIYANVVTTIQNPTKALTRLAEMAAERAELLFVIGDRKTPLDFSLPNSKYLSVHDQEDLDYQVTKNLPWNSYTRKMLGYLEAAKAGCRFIRETDDDNFPLKPYFLNFPDEMKARKPNEKADWLNPYIYFSDEYIWPRGYPIELIAANRKLHFELVKNCHETTVSRIGVVQGLADGAPDVDALYRLVYQDSGEFEFNKSEPLVIPKGTFAPFNSQVTTWNIELLPLMYLPQTCTFRMTDIWRSFIATHLMHLNDFELVFTSASAFQDRNVHNLLRDFSDEVPGYIGNNQFINALKSIPLLEGKENIIPNLLKIYSELISKEFFRPDEIISLQSWISDCRNY